MFSRDYCRDIGDSARIADDEQGHKLFAGEGFHRPSMFLFRNSMWSNLLRSGKLAMGDTVPAAHIVLHTDHSPDGAGAPSCSSTAFVYFEK